MVLRARRDVTRLTTLLIGILLLIALSSVLVFAQGFSAAISGVVHDTTGAVVPGVSVIVKHIESGLTRIAVTSENGGCKNLRRLAGPRAITPHTSGLKQ